MEIRTDAQIHKMVIDLALGVLSAGSLDDENIFASHRILDLTAALANGELCEDAVAGRHAQHGANVIDQAGVGVASKDDDIADHCRCWISVSS